MLLVSWVGDTGTGARGARGATWWVGGPLGIHSDLQETSSYILSATLQHLQWLSVSKLLNPWPQV